ncbi:MAG: multidrug effflux MFS transporter [Anaerolineaceae bacterium]|nr:multidrug effflux MFS transporter [Anaerolineaceae bacterium]
MNITAAQNAPQPQKYLGAKGLIVLIALLSAFVPLSTDLYLPALPSMSAYFNVSADLINLTLIGFFVFYALGTLLWGPLSDKYGRKPILLIGLTLYVLASISCANAWNVYVLILFRILQAVGGSAAGAIATAIVKEVYQGRQRESVLAMVQSMVLISPALAPVLGAFLMGFTSWHGIFWSLSIIGVLALAGTLLFQETITERVSGNVQQSLLRLGRVLQNRSFTSMLILFSLLSISSMAFIASSTYIYQNGFHLSNRVYSYYFSLNALGFIYGPMLYLQLSRRIHYKVIIPACFIVIVASGLLVALLGNLQPWVFALCILPASIAGSCVRPPSANLMLGQHVGDAGSVSSLMGCIGLLFGSLGVELVSLNWSNLVLVLGCMNIISGVLCIIFWPGIYRKAKKIDDLEPVMKLAASSD